MGLSAISFSLLKRESALHLHPRLTPEARTVARLSFIFATVGVTLILLVFGVWDARRIGRSHAACASRDVSLMASSRLLVWGIAVSVAGLVLVPAAHAPEVRFALIGADLVLGAAVLILRREAHRTTHDLRGS